MAAELGYVVLLPGHITAQRVTVTPSATPVQGTGRMDITVGVNATTPLVPTIDGNDLVFRLPVWAKENDVLHWISYDS
jgi:hypothetical protein